MPFDPNTAKPVFDPTTAKPVGGGFDPTTAKPVGFVLDSDTTRQKGLGFLGSLPTTDGTGRTSTELSIGVNFDGKETEIPSLVPTLNQSEIDFLLAGNKPTKAIVDKAVEHAKTRMSQGKNVFAQEGEQTQESYGDIVAEKVKPTLTPSIPLGTMQKPAAMIESLIKSLAIPQEAMVAAIPRDGKDYKERFKEGKLPSEVIPTVQVPGGIPVGVQKLAMDIGLDPLIIPAGKLVKPIGRALKMLEKLGKSKSAKAVLDVLKRDKQFKELLPNYKNISDEKLMPEIQKAMREAETKPIRRLDAKTPKKVVEVKAESKAEVAANKIAEKAMKKSKAKQAKNPYLKVDEKELIKEAEKGNPNAMTAAHNRNVKFETPEDVIKLGKVLEDLPALLKEQKMLTKKGRFERFRTIKEMESKYSGQELVKKKRQYLKEMGEMEKVEFSPIASKFSQKELDNLFNRINKSTELSTAEKLPAETAMLKMLEGRIPFPSEYEMLGKVYPKEMIDALKKNLPFMKKFWNVTAEALNLPRAMMATGDLSAPLRQGLFFIRRQKQFAPAVRDMFKFAFKEKAYDDFMTTLKKNKYYDLMEDSKLSLTDIGGDFLKREEQFMSSWAEKIPIFGKIARGSNRAYTGFLTKLRADVFTDLIKKADKLGDLKRNPDLPKQIAEYINDATGRGKLPKSLENSTRVLANAFFAPKLVASRLRLASGKYVTADKFVRKEFLKDLFGLLSVGTTVLTLSKLAGAEVGTDARSSDFGKIKIGNTRYDIWGGFQQLFVLAERIRSGEMISSTTGKEFELGEGYKPITRLDIASRFFEYKLSPGMSFVLGAFRGKTALGEEFKVAPEVAKRLVPMFWQDIYELAQEEGWEGVPMAMPGAFGTGVQTYGDKNKNKKRKPRKRSKR